MSKQFFFQTSDIYAYQILRRCLFLSIESLGNNQKQKLELKKHFSLFPQKKEPTRNNYIEFCNLRIKILPKSPNLSEIILTRIGDENLEFFNQLSLCLENDITNRKAITLEPGPGASREEWFIYYTQSKQSGKHITHKYIADKLHLTPNYVRQLYTRWKYSYRDFNLNS